MSNATPSPSPLPERDRALYVRDMLGFCDVILAYTAGHNLAGLLTERMRYDATLRNLELIGEAATHVPDDVRALAPGIPWRQVVGTRNRLAHAYLGIEAETVWMLIEHSVPDLKIQLVQLLSKMDSEASLRCGLSLTRSGKPASICGFHSRTPHAHRLSRPRRRSRP